jgi:aminopeptidase N
MRASPFLVLFLASWLCGPGPSAAGQTFTRQDSLRGQWHELRSNQDLLHYHLRLRIRPDIRYIEGSNRMTFRALEDLRVIQADLDPSLDVLSVETEKGEAQFSRSGSSLRIKLPEKINSGSVFRVDVAYRGHPRVSSNAPWESGFVWAKDRAGFHWAAVACEGTGASVWFPSKDHPADEPDSVRLEFEVPAGLTAVGNGTLLGRRVATDSTHIFTYRTVNPVNHYNVTLAIGPYRIWTDTLLLPHSRKILPLSFYSLPEDEKPARVQWQQAKKVLSRLSSWLGDYPFREDGYRLVQTPFLGMEHQSCIAYGDRFLNNTFGFDFILMHESAHEWWGNALSGNDKADMWIHESFCTYSEAWYVEQMHGPETAREYLLAQKKKIRNKSPVQGPRSVAFNDWKDSDMYYKGTWMLHSLRYCIGNDSLWFSVFPELLARTGRKPVSGDSLRAFFSRYFGRDLGPFFRQYLDQTAWPELEYRRGTAGGPAEFRWKGVVPGFACAVPVRIGSQVLRVEAGPDWVPAGGNEPGEIQEAGAYFLYRLKEYKP